MILGLVSFGFIMYLFTNSPTKDFQMTFEVAHVFVFLFAIFHSLMVALAVFVSLNLSKRWKMFERMDLVKYLELKEKYRKLTDKRTAGKNFVWRYFGWWITAPGRLFTYSKLHEVMAFHDIRWQFIYYRNLQPDFRFSKFLRKIKMATFIELVEIHPLNWSFLMIITALDILRIKIGSSPDFDAIFFICHSAFTTMSVTVLAWKIHRVYWQMTKNPATYYDTVDPHAFREELNIAEEEARIRRESIGSLIEVDDTTSRKSRFSISRKSRDRTSRQSHDSGHAKHHHNPIYHKMALKPGEHGHGHGHGHSDSEHPHALNLAKRRGDRIAPADESAKPAPYDPTGDTIQNTRNSGRVANQLLDQARRQHEERPGFDRMSLDMQAVMPKSELDLRAVPAGSIEDFWDEGQSKLKHMSTSRRNLRMEALRRLRERKRRNAAIVETAQNLQEAQQSAPSRSYPRWLLKFFPRLGRVPSAAEKLFWFGSHRFYLFCMENVLFFMNVNLAASISKLIFWHKEMNEYLKEKAAKNVAAAAKMVLIDAVRAAAKAGKEKKPQEPPKETIALLIVALVVAALASGYVLLRVAGIMRKYIFVLNNANLLPEDMTVTTIQTLNLKDMMNAETMHDGSGEPLATYDSETDGEGEHAADFKQLRRNMSQFLEDEQKKTLSPASPLMPATPDARF